MKITISSPSSPRVHRLHGGAGSVTATSVVAPDIFEILDSSDEERSVIFVPEDWIAKGVH